LNKNNNQTLKKLFARIRGQVQKKFTVLVGMTGFERVKNIHQRSQTMTVNEK
jgi:hypothetical protein